MARWYSTFIPFLILVIASHTGQIVYSLVVIDCKFIYSFVFKVMSKNPKTPLNMMQIPKQYLQEIQSSPAVSG